MSRFIPLPKLSQLAISALIMAVHCISLGINPVTAFADSGGPVLVIVRGSDPSGAGLNQTFIDDARQARELYQKAGFQVIELDDSVEHPLTAEQIKTSIAGIKTSELHLVLLNHGSSNEKHEFRLQPSAITQEKIITGTQIKEAVLGAIKANPQLKIYVPALSCYSGALGDQLSDVPGVLVLPATSANAPTVLSEKFDPFAILLTGLSQHQTYFEAQESAWQKQLTQFSQPDFAISESIPDTHLPVPMKDLPFLRTGPQLFLESWCAKQAQESWATGQFCTGNTSVKIPDGLKVVALGDVQVGNQLHLTQLQKLVTTECSGSRADLNASSYNSLRTSLVKQSIDRLKAKVNSITAEDFRKNQIAQFQGYIDQIRQGMMSGVTEADEQQQIGLIEKAGAPQLKAAMDAIKASVMAHIQSFEHDCGQGPFDPDKTLVFGTDKTTCGNYFAYTPDDWATFSPEDLNAPAAGDMPILEAVSPTASLSTWFKDYPKNLLNFIAKLGEKYPVQAAMMTAAINGLPSLKGYCDLVAGSVLQTKQDQACTEKFKADASAGDWVRFLDLNSLGHRKLLSGSGP